ncbi:F219A-like protein [Mya arenaria]|uniref:F219A-like protein n=1 Tax=Mya arenaria TaxID=6604 RepID=A0ABY7DRR5_MYAAR|nr:protein FAM219A-like [Mya arenaria]WAR00393.1 F219A-like protein [Mya arenaria]
MDTMDDSGIDSDNKTGPNDNFSTENNVDGNQSSKIPNGSDNGINAPKSINTSSELQKKIEKQREKNRRKGVVDDQPKKSFLLPRSRLNIPSKLLSSSLTQKEQEQPLVSLLSDDSEEDEFAVGAPLSREAQREITAQLIKDGYNLDLEPDDEDLDLIPPRPLHERWSCCPAATWVPHRCALQ